MQFVWDRRKAAINLRKHRIPFENAIPVFTDPLARIFADRNHSETEERELIVGYDATGHILIVSFVERNDNVRIISARRATSKEVHAHETYIK